jgi:anti-sigma factor RsiW
MSECQAIDPLVTPYVDGELPETDRDLVDRHLRRCPPCHSRVNAERAVHELLHARRDALAAPCASSALRARCSEQARLEWAAAAAPPWRSRLAPLAAAASLVLIVGAAFLYQLTASSNRVLAAELAADHVKCFALNGMLQTHDDASAVENMMMSLFNWRMHVLPRRDEEDVELVGSRLCMSGEGRVAHIMYRHHGEPVSLFMLPREARSSEMVQALGHRAAIWCEGDRTFVLIGREPEQEIARMATLVQASLK